MIKTETKTLKPAKHNNIKIILISSIIGIVAGIVTVLYRFSLTRAEDLSFFIYDFVANNKIFIPILFICLAIIGYLIGVLVKKFPLISGSGIPQVKGEILGYIKGTWLGTLVMKFIAGTISIIAGLSLGREGPSIQLGACVAQGISSKLAKNQSDKKIYTASGASAGLAAAFNAPMAGVMFALEEIFKYFSPMVLLSTMVSAVFADYISKIFFGTDTVFHFDITQKIDIMHYWIIILLGIVLGFSGVIYNFCCVKSQEIYKKIKFKNPTLKFLIPFICAGILGLTFPIVLCGGHSVVTELDISASIIFLLVVFVIKFLFSMISFGSGAPGGIFFPLLVLGSIIGAIFAKIFIPIMGMSDAVFYNFVILAMCGYFAAIVRAPLTGIILLVEMTGSFSQILPLIVTSAVAYVVAEELKSKPIYELLLENLLKSRGVHKEPEDNSKILLEAVVHFGAKIDNRPVKNVLLPEKCLIISIKRGNSEITPNGNTIILAEDYLTIIADASKEKEARECLEKMVTR
ncbi:MAG: ClC family H(+)/Cl(-) exchange transporter [Clostridia bacterium]